MRSPIGAALVFLASVLASRVGADPGITPCTASQATGDICEAELSSLRPTQFGVGLLEVAAEREALEKLTPEARRHQVSKKRIAVVIGPEGRFWLVDRHHLTRALWDMGERRMPVHVVGRVEQSDHFWDSMRQAHWAWLFDERGNPRDPADLPPEVKDLPDYPYRSLAGFAENEHFFDKPTQVYFIEFAWAKYFGDQLGWAEVTAESLRQRLDEARHLACLPGASSLPGYPGRVCAH